MHTRGVTPASSTPAPAVTTVTVAAAGPRRVAQAAAVAAVTVPAVLFAHLLTTGQTAAPAASVLCALLVLVVTAAVPVRSPAGLGLLAGTAQVGAHAVLAALPGASGAGGTGTGGCLPAVGRGAELGLRLAVLRPDAACPPGMLAPGSSLTAALAAVLTALTIIAGHAGVAALTGLLLAGAERVVVTLAALAAVMVLATVRVVTVVAAPSAVHAAPDVVRRLRDQVRPGPAVLRGPPAGAVAA